MHHYGHFLTQCQDLWNRSGARGQPFDPSTSSGQAGPGKKLQGVQDLVVLARGGRFAPVVNHDHAEVRDPELLLGEGVSRDVTGDLSIWSVADPYAPSSLGSYAPLDRFTVSGSLVAGLDGQNLRA